MVKVTQHSWLGGVLGRQLMGRQDIDRYASGASEIVNFLPQLRGSLAKRPGTDKVADMTSFTGTDAPFRMIPFGYRKDDGRVLVVKSGAMRVYGRSGYVADVTGTVPAYTADDLASLCPAQCGDVLFLASQTHPPAKVSHTAENAYVFAQCVFNPQPARPKITAYDLTRRAFNYISFVGNRGGIYDYDNEDQNRAKSYAGVTEVLYSASVVDADGNETTLAALPKEDPAGDNDSPNDAASHTSKTIENTYSKSGLSADVLRIRFFAPWTDSQVVKVTVRTELTDFKELRLYKNIAGTYGLVGVAAKALCTHGTGLSGQPYHAYQFVDDNIAPDTSISPLKDKTVFASAGNYPAAVAVYQQRLVWASTANDPARVWMSATGDLYQHRPHVTVQADDPIDFILPITRFAKINFIVEMRKLLMFSEACEWLVSSNSSAEGVSYDTIQATPHSYIGCSPRLPPIVANNSILFAERTGRAVRSYGYQLENDGFGGTDISVFSAQLFEGRTIVDWTYQQHPQPTVWCVLDDGTLASCVYMPDQEVCAWAAHRLGGGGKAKAIACTWALEGDTSTVMVAVHRGTAMMLEAFRRQPGPRATIEEAMCIDYAHVVPAGEAVPDDGRIAVPLADGARLVGFPFESSFTSVYPAISDERIGAAQFDVRTVQDVALRLRMGKGGTVRAAQAPRELATPLPDVELTMDGNGVIDFPQVDARVVLAGVNDGDGRVTVAHDGQWPFEVTLMETDIDVEARSEE